MESVSILPAELTPEEIQQALELVRLSAAGLPLVDDPWAWLAGQMQMDIDDTLQLLRRLQSQAAIRRIAAVPNHYKLGYRHNGMTVWDVCDEHVDQLGALLARQDFVSHCYRRPRRAGWRYNLFAMVHGRSASEIDSYRQQLRTLLGTASQADEMLVSSAILKKTGLRLGPEQPLTARNCV